MKKILLIALAVAVGFCLPLTAQAKTEFELGGYIRLDAWWASQNGFSTSFSGYSAARQRLNFANHGKFVMNANASRFNFTIKGPELWGGKVMGFIEADFDGQPVTRINAGTTTVLSRNDWFFQPGRAAPAARHVQDHLAGPGSALRPVLVHQQ